MLFTSTSLQSTTYLLGVCLFSISFLVFLNASVSFVITDRIASGVQQSVGDYVGTLGFADELLALIACPLWGLLSDRIGVRTVCTLGYAVIALSLAVFVQAKNVYPQLLLARLLFSIGGAAATTMVTAILPAVTEDPTTASNPEGTYARSHGQTPSLASELTITPARHGSAVSTVNGNPNGANVEYDAAASSSKVAGVVGTFTGLGALLAVGVFLPLPARFIKSGVSAGQAIADAYYVVAGIALVVSLFCLVGLRGLHGQAQPTVTTKEERNGFGVIQSLENYKDLFMEALLLGRKDSNVSLAFLGGAVARASSVGISLFIPLYIHNYFLTSGRCNGKLKPGEGAGGAKKDCPEAYILSARTELTGVSQLAALIVAPLIGHLSASPSSARFNIPLLLGSAFGVVSYILFPFLSSPLPSVNPSVFVLSIFIGLSQITAIVCSLGLLSRGIHSTTAETAARAEEAETAPLLNDTYATSPAKRMPRCTSKAYLKGSVAGLYSVAGGAGILLLTKLGGWMFDASSSGAPFWILAGFNGLLLVAGVLKGLLARTETATEIGDDGQ
ncbi:MAG: hypothetical protein M1814_004838 [Vezdaea aestivalis]|nr:MAG: hypothetical protein M1814_004838 [Vezdaea aestivalis]